MAGEVLQAAWHMQEVEEDNDCPVTDVEAAHMFDRCLPWLKHQDEADQYNTSTH